MKELKKTDNLFNAVRDLIEESRRSIARQVNTAMVFTYYYIGKMIVEDEQDGKEKALYSSETLKQLSLLLTKEYGKGYSVDNLEKIRKFYLIYEPKISESVIRKSVSASLNLFQELFKLSWTHYFHLLKINDDSERSFYEAEASERNWSIREMQRQINSSLYERLALSRNHNEIIAKSQKGAIYENPIETLKSPFVLEFLGLREDHYYSEGDLEKPSSINLNSLCSNWAKAFYLRVDRKESRWMAIISTSTFLFTIAY